MGILRDKIEHIVVLMLENRSFDSMLGRLYPGKPEFDGLTGTESNPYHDHEDIQVWGNAGVDQKSMTVPDPDPGELWTDINMQLFGLDSDPSSKNPTMKGFVNNYMRQTDQSPADYLPESVMHYYNPAQVPVISALAKQFAVCDQWFASAPCQTWPNRFFVHTGTAGGYENNSPAHFPYLTNTIFNRLGEANKPWKIYFHDFPQTLTLTHLWPSFDKFRDIGELMQDAKNDTLPAYSFIELRYFPDVELPNDQHPPHNVGMGEKLIFDVYNAVRNSPAWDKTLLIITYDEHGGSYDHVAPPLAVPPDNSQSQPFDFERYGVRVPAVLISPYIKSGTILRSIPSGNLESPYAAPPFDHTSIIATVRKCFDLGAALTNRDAVAPDLETVLNLASPDNAGPENLQPLSYVVSESDLQKALAMPLNDFQKGLHEAATHLPPLDPVRDVESILKNIESHVANLINGVRKEVPDHKTPTEAIPFIKNQLKAFLAR